MVEDIEVDKNKQKQAASKSQQSKSQVYFYLTAKFKCLVLDKVKAIL